MMPRRILMTAVLTLMSATFAAAQAKNHAVFAALDSPLDVTKVKVNDPVSAKLCESVTLDDGTKLPANALLTGHVVSVKDSSGSLLAVVFDHVQVGDKEPMTVAVTVRRVDNAPDEDGMDVEPSDIKSTGNLVSKVHGVSLVNAVEGAASATFSSKGDRMYLDYRTLLGCLVASK